MADAPSYLDLAEAAGISRSYANEIVVRGKTPSRPLAIHILRRTGWRHASLADLTDEQIGMLEAIEPWTSRAASGDQPTVAKAA